MEPLVRIEEVSKTYPRIQKSRERLQAFTSLLLGREPTLGIKVLENINLLSGDSLLKCYQGTVYLNGFLIRGQFT